MRYEVLLAETMNKSYNPLTTGSVLKQVGRYNAPHTAPGNEQLKARYLLGCVYRDMGEAPAECFTITRTFNSMMRAR